MQTQSSVSEIDEELSAYFDNELDEAIRAQVEAELDTNPELAAKLADLSFMRTMVIGDLEHQAERVPEARFEQLWDSFEHTLERESRLQEAAEAPPPLWQRLAAWVQPFRMPLAAVAGVGALAFVIARSVGAPSEDESGAIEVAENSVVENTQEVVASEAEPRAIHTERGPERRFSPKPKPQIAIAPPRKPAPQIEPDVFPKPVPGEAEIRRIEFGGKMGTISQVEGRRGTTTVIWVTEDEVPIDSERSL